LLKIEKLPNLYRLLLPGDKPNKPTGAYYALIERGRKQFRRSPRTAETAGRKLAQGRLAELNHRRGDEVTGDTGDSEVVTPLMAW